MNTSRLLGVICTCLIACYSASTNATKDVRHIDENSSHAVSIENIAPRDNRIKYSNTSGVENAVFFVSVGLIGYLLLRKVNNG
jgi:hypothetical protein